MSEEDKLIQQELVEEIMKASEQFPNVILYMETVMESYEELEKENQQLKDKINTYENPEDLTLMFMYCDEKAKDKIKQLKEVIEEVRELRDQFIDENELLVWENDSLINFVNKLLQILDKAGDIDEKKN